MALLTKIYPSTRLILPLGKANLVDVMWLIEQNDARKKLCTFFRSHPAETLIFQHQACGNVFCEGDQTFGELAADSCAIRRFL